MLAGWKGNHRSKTGKRALQLGNHAEIQTWTSQRETKRALKQGEFMQTAVQAHDRGLAATLLQAGHEALGELPPVRLGGRHPVEPGPMSGTVEGGGSQSPEPR